MKGFFESLVSKEGIISILLVIAVCTAFFFYNKKRDSKGLSTKSVVAIGIGSALYGVLSFISIPVGPNTSFRISIALLTIFGAIFGPIVGFLVGFIGHALNDAIAYGGVWWSWVFLAAVIGLFGGLITLDKSFNVRYGKLEKKHIIKMYIFAVVSIVPACLIAYLGDVFLYGEPADKVLLQIVLASISNIVVMAVIGIPVVIGLAKINKKNTNLERD